MRFYIAMDHTLFMYKTQCICKLFRNGQKSLKTKPVDPDKITQRDAVEVFNYNCMF